MANKVQHMYLSTVILNSYFDSLILDRACAMYLSNLAHTDDCAVGNINVACCYHQGRINSSWIYSARKLNSQEKFHEMLSISTIIFNVHGF